jgi:hypothetical protein
VNGVPPVSLINHHWPYMFSWISTSLSQQYTVDVSFELVTSRLISTAGTLFRAIVFPESLPDAVLSVPLRFRLDWSGMPLLHCWALLLVESDHEYDQPISANSCCRQPPAAGTTPALTGKLVRMVRLDGSKPDFAWLFPDGRCLCSWFSRTVIYSHWTTNNNADSHPLLPPHQQYKF